MTRSLTFTLARPLVLLANRRLHWRAKGKLRDAMSREVMALTAGQRPEAPFARARVIVERWSVGEPDYDGLVSSCKPLLDVLQPCSKRHPAGLGIIADDKISTCRLDARHVRAARRVDQRTVVTVEELG